MVQNLQMNAERFTGFADVYDNARPKYPEKAKDIILKYLGRNPSVVVDIGCGTGLSTLGWSEVSKEVIGVDPCTDMLDIARQKAAGLDNVRFVSSFSDETELDDDFADIITCSQSFHWMNPETTLREVARVLKDRGVFAVYDCDWPPVCNWEAEKEYNALFNKVREFEIVRPELKNSFKSWPKDEHLLNIENGGKFQYVRELGFSTNEECDAQRFIAIALSQGGLQSILKAGIIEFEPYLRTFESGVKGIFGNRRFTIEFCYRMIIAVK
jgi:ubiquinone/menaquinone biosynthesis C-methylase UbiE